MTTPPATGKGSLCVMVAGAALLWALLTPGCRTGEPAGESPPAATARTTGRGTAHRTFRSERQVTIERPEYASVEGSEEKPPVETTDATATDAKEKALTALGAFPEKAAEEKKEKKAAAATLSVPASAGKETAEEAADISQPPPAKAEPQGAAGTAGSGGGASDWEKAFIADMQGVIDAKQGRAALSKDDLADTFPVADEIQVGEAVAARILSEAPEYDDRALWEYVSFVGLSLAEQSRRNDLAYHFVVLDAPEEINAFAAPGGFVFITSGAIRFCRNEAELAAILAHEIGHVSLRHGLRALDRGKYRVLSQSAVAEMDAARKRIYGEDSRPDRLKKIEEELAGIADDCYEQTQAPFARGMENEADRASVKLLAAAGYNPYAALRLMERLASTGTKEAAFARALRSHPAPRERVAVLRKALRSLGLRDRGARCTERFQHFRDRVH